MRVRFLVLIAGLFSAFTLHPLYAQGVLTFEDVMKFEDIGTTDFSSNGNWVAYSVWPDRGDGYVQVKQIRNGKEYRIELGDRPTFSGNEKWLAAFRRVPLAVQLKEKKNAPKQGLSLLNLSDGQIREFGNVSGYEFSNDGRWLAIKHFQSKEIEDLNSKNKYLGTNVLLLDLDQGTEDSLGFVREISFDSLSTYLAWSRVDTSGKENGLYVRSLRTGETTLLDVSDNRLSANLTWEPKSSRLAFTNSRLDSSYKAGEATLNLWNPNARRNKLQTLVEPGEVAEGYALTTNNRLVFTHDGNRLFFGLMDQEMANLDQSQSSEEEDKEMDIYDIDTIVDEREMDLWHGDDPEIKTREKITWNSRKNHLFTSVYHLKRNEWVQLADKSMPNINIDHNREYVLGYDNQPYLKEVTWDGWYNDIYVVSLKDGTRTKILERYGGEAYLSPKGHRVVYYQNKHWHVYNTASGDHKTLTRVLDVPFFNEDHDYPSAVPGYGIAGWVNGGDAVLIYDKYDIWQFPLIRGNYKNITNGEGRAQKRIFRVIKTGDTDHYKQGDKLLLSSYHDLKKNFGFYESEVGTEGTRRLLEEDKKFTFVAKANNADRILYKREAYDEFPNLWMSDDSSFNQVQRISELHLNLKEKWNWGTAELVDWLSIDGTYLQGVVIKPDNYDPTRRYPVLTYFYRFFSDRLHDFNEPKTNHRPVFAQYVSDGYVVFLPDIRFEIGRPGFSATKSLVPGIHKLIELGIADEDKLGLHGHSWSGYQTAFIVTQTDIFDAAVSGAPVSNMTSAYSGIRWASGLARQFQYEKTQSRIGESLVDAPEKYIENSPVFFADKITTPMLIQHGDADGAVPWYQSIEMYLAMRRFNKDVIFLQYHNEPHHLQKFANKLDYAIRMKEYFDYYLRGIGEPEWILKGEAYKGK